MATTFIVTKVRREISQDGTHAHIAAVCTLEELTYSCRQVVESIDEGDTWVTRVGGVNAIVKPVRCCPYDGCKAAPYLETNPDSVGSDNLENLPGC
jgi:hypothetical protein